MKYRNRRSKSLYCESLESKVLLSTLSSRWSSTATGGGLTQGDATIVTWSIVPDGTTIGAAYGSYGEVTGPSNLVAFLGNGYGVTTPDTNYTDEPWFASFQNTLDRWGSLGGIDYVYANYDDGASLGSVGVLGVRADVRIGGHRIDGASSILAYNYYPNNGDMVIDTTENFSTANNARLVAAISHEFGHGLGLAHVISNNSAQLMEPYIDTSLSGPQFDDIYGLQTHYGDNNEQVGNDTTTKATPLGQLSSVIRVGLNGSTTTVLATDTDFISIDDETDVDFYSFTTVAGIVNIQLTPVGPTYSVGPQGGTEAIFNASIQNDLTLQIVDSNGNIVVSSNTGGLGISEFISSQLAGGTYYVKITGSTLNKLQMYRLDLEGFPQDSLTLSIDKDSIWENDSIYPAVGTVTRSGSTATDLAVTIISNDLLGATAQTTIIIPAGSSSANFNIYPVDDLELDPNSYVTFTVSAPSYISGSDTITILDNEIPLGIPVTVTVNKLSISEYNGSATGTITRGGDLSQSLTIYLYSSNITAATVPTTVIIPAGASSATFKITAVDDTIKDGTQKTMITAVLNSEIISSTELSVTDNEKGKGRPSPIKNNLVLLDRLFSNWTM